MSLIINTFFTKGGSPELGLVPTIRIWEINDATNTLVIGGPDPTVSEVGDGFYKYVFTVGLGFDETKTYIVRVDGGNTLTPGERYSVASTEETALSQANIDLIVDNVWDETATDHITVGSTGELLNNTAACCTTTATNVVSVLNMVTDLLKYQCNKTEIDKINKTLTIFDDDKITPLKIFDLKDSSNVPSVTEICIRDPQ